MKLPIYPALVAFVISTLVITNAHTAQTALNDRQAKLKSVTEQLAAHIRPGNQDRAQLEHLLNQWKDELKKSGIASEPERVKALALDLTDGKNVAAAQTEIKAMATSVRNRANQLKSQALGTGNYVKKMQAYDAADLLQNYVTPIVDTIVGSLKVEAETAPKVTENQGPTFRRRINMAAL